MIKSMGETSAMCRKRRVNRSESLFNAIWMALMLSCTVACISRLLWAVQPLLWLGRHPRSVSPVMNGHIFSPNKDSSL